MRRQWPGKADYADLVQEGRIGLWLAILRYEPERGHTFATFAGRAIRNRVWNAVKWASKAQGWLEPQRAGDSLGLIMASLAGGAAASGAAGRIGLFARALAAGARAGIWLGRGGAAQAGYDRAAAGNDEGAGAAAAQRRLGIAAPAGILAEVRRLYGQDSARSIARRGGDMIYSGAGDGTADEHRLGFDHAIVPAISVPDSSFQSLTSFYRAESDCYSQPVRGRTETVDIELCSAVTLGGDRTAIATAAENRGDIKLWAGRGCSS